MDNTESIRRVVQAELNTEARQLAETTDDPRTVLEAKYGRVWSTQEMTADYSVTSFLAPFVGVTRKSDGAEGTLAFCHSPRFYHSFSPV